MSTPFLQILNVTTATLQVLRRPTLPYSNHQTARS
ncbi:uncharacterized protein CCOS01_07578 [Colletotrichum costaricense]|uniref:Uncharacterized protein n=2 Tax=Colletotrichum acutatum species complex TaxID=2707335 RepID=A0AAI9YXZ6_9PEZI|nr:uncharacterized protein CCOS01_07578 [Colletotrichum costaricense]XP_060377882.1 uncharacterized protein CTAM01_11431 [Colletotrichum tamarilloi]KAI3531469.1 hypothetical protein CSPX01_14129 [Colletotrichum filicis]KAK1488208.1 hypothetical protein CTAM01_11431 [Colletotrichum tamarilloi]KAK1527316.1 hypothetical protein CCOS01_07578 [Colletotrichum costaricense]